MKKAYCGLVSFKDGEKDMFVVGEIGTTPSRLQPGALYGKLNDVLSGAISSSGSTCSH